MSMVALMTDYVARISLLKIVLGNDDKRTAILKGKNRLYDLLLPENIELREEAGPAEGRYGKYRFPEKDDNKWMEMYAIFEEFVKSTIAQADLQK